MKAPYRLGNSGLEVTAIGLGCWQFSRSRGLAGRFWPAMAQQTVRDVVQASLQGGINWFDTAEVYGKGASEESLAQALHELAIERERYVLADKWFPAFRFASSIGRSFETRERALHGIAQPSRATIDLYQIHQPFSFSAVERQMGQMAALLQSGKIRSVGVSNFNERLMRRAHARLAAAGIPLASNQMRYSLLDREIERNGVLETASELGITIIAYSPLAQGLLTGKFHGEQDIRRSKGPRKWFKRFKPPGLEATQPLIDELQSVAGSQLVTPAQVALAWVVQQHGTSVVAIAGASSVKQAQANAEALSLELTPQQLERLDVAGRESERRLKRL